MMPCCCITSDHMKYHGRRPRQCACLKAEVQTSPNRSRSMQLPDRPGRANCAVSGVKDARLMTERPKLAQLPSLPKVTRRRMKEDGFEWSPNCLNYFELTYMFFQHLSDPRVTLRLW